MRKSPRARRCRHAIWSAVLGALLVVLGCGPREPELPEGALLSGHAEPLSRLLADLETLSGSPAARMARATRERLGGCEQVEARAATAAGLADAVRCVEPAAAEPLLEELRGEDDFVVLLPLAGGRATGRGRVGPEGGVTVEIELPPPADDDPFSPLLPRAEPLGEAVLSRRDALLLGRLGSDRGLDLASAVAAEGVVDRLFKLRNQLFSSVVLSGVWELAVYAPGEGGETLPIAVALELESRTLGAAAMGRFLRDLEEEWPLLRRPFAVGDAVGECVKEVEVLPDLVPCYVIAGDALVVGWNAAAVEKALAGEASSELAGESRLVIELERFPAAERRLSASVYGDEAAAATVYPWRRAVFSGRRDGEVYALRLELLPAK